MIEPSRYLRNGRLLKVKRLGFPSLTLPYLAALTPSDVEVSICIEQLEEVDFDERADLAAITSYTDQAHRAYEIADQFRARGMPVVMGGIHVSMEPQEALQHADTVIVGEADETWPQFIRDFRSGSPKRLYTASRPPSLAGLPRPKFSLLDDSRILAHRKGALYRLAGLPAYPVQTARGCPHACDFCSVTRFFGSRYRARPIPEVIDEITSLGARSIIFVDDDIFAHPRRAGELFEALIPLRLIWLGQASIGAARDEELMRLAARSGCTEVCVGLESLSDESLRSVGKTSNNVREYERLLRVFRRHGIAVIGSLMFGFDTDTPSVFRETFDFLVRNNVHSTIWWPVTPFPGTPLFERLKKQGRLKEEKWWLHRKRTAAFPDLTFTGISMDEAIFRRNFLHYYNRYLSTWRIIRRAFIRPVWKLPMRIVVGFILRQIHAALLNP